MEGKLLHGYEYGAMNRLARSWNDQGQESLYRYNGLGQRIGKNVNGDEEDYLLDLTRGYHNLLGIQKDNSGQYFYFGGNVTSMEEIGGRVAEGGNRNRNGRTALPGLHYYMQDELGSPMRVNGFKEKENTTIGKSTYLAYGYDEFGNDLGRELEEAGIPNLYNRQGIEQPFGYTGYQYDEVSGTYFAQAREYQPENGRFGAEDVIKGNNAALATLNQYSYCWNKPIDLVDKNGKSSDVPVDIFIPEDWEFEDKSDGNSIPLQAIPFTYIPDTEIPDDIIERPFLAIYSFENTIKEEPEVFYPDTAIEPYASDSISLEKEIKIFNISVEGGTGLYVDFNIDGIGGQLGGKSYWSYSNQGKYFSKCGVELSGGIDAFVGGADAGYQYVWYPMLDTVAEEGWFVDPSICGFKKEGPDMVFSIGGSLYVAMGLGAQIDINFSEMRRRIQKKLNDFFSESEESSEY